MTQSAFDKIAAGLEGVLVFTPTAEDLGYWMPLMELRWSRPPTTTTQQDVLEQAFRHSKTGAIEWRPIPIHIQPPHA